MYWGPAVGAWMLTVVAGRGGLEPGAPEPNAAHPRDYTLVWEAPDDCPTEDEIRARVEVLLGGPRSGQGTAEVSAYVDAVGVGFSMSMRTRFAGEAHERVLEARTCAELAEATAVLLAITLEPAREQRSGPPLRDPVAVPLPPTAGAASVALGSRKASDPPAAAPELVARGPRQSPPSFGRRRYRPVATIWGAGAGVEVGALGAATAALRMSLGLFWAQGFGVEASGTYLAPRVRRRGDRAGAMYQLGSAAARGCWRSAPERWAFVGCLGVEAGGLWASTRGIDPPATRVGPFFGPSAAVGILHRWRRVGVRLGGEAVVRAVGSETTIGGQPALQQFPVSVRGLAGVEVYLP